MVDGVKVGDMIGVDGVVAYELQKGTDGKGCPTKKYMGSQDFQDADMVVIRSKAVSEDKGEDTVFECYGIYGNNIVTAGINKIFITQGVNKRVVWAYRKPYILSGDLQSYEN